MEAIPRGRARVIRIGPGAGNFAAIGRVATTGSSRPFVRLFKASVARCAAKRSGKISGDDLSEVKKVLIKAGVIKDPYEGKTTDELAQNWDFRKDN